MRTREHVLKADRIEATLRKLDAERDYEMIIETCMLAATHFLNAALHTRGITHGHSDQSHTIRPPLEFFRKPVDAELEEAMKPLKFIESLRPLHVRGGAPHDPQIVNQCLEAFETAKQGFLNIIGDEADKPPWE